MNNSAICPQNGASQGRPRGETLTENHIALTRMRMVDRSAEMGNACDYGIMRPWICGKIAGKANPTLHWAETPLALFTRPN